MRTLIFFVSICAAGVLGFGTGNHVKHRFSPYPQDIELGKFYNVSVSFAITEAIKGPIITMDMRGLKISENVAIDAVIIRDLGGQP